MKLQKALLLTLTTVALPLGSLSLSAAVQGPPAYIDYQGLVFDSTTQNPLGSTGTSPNFVADPTNYTIQFKVYDALTDGNLIWAESQTVTVSLGSFAVRLGSGAPISGLVTDPAHYHASLADAFEGNERYLELTVFPSGQASGSRITPRMAFQSSPFALVAGHAKVADSIAGGVFSGAIDASGGTFTGGTFSGTTVTGGTFSGNGAGLTSLDATELTGNVGDGNLSANVALLNRPAQTFTGKIGIGATATGGFLDTALNIREGGISIYRDENSLTLPFTQDVQVGEIRGHSNYFGNSNGQLRLTAGTVTDANVVNMTAIDLNAYGTEPSERHSIKFYTNGTEKLRLNNSGFLGIAQPTPSSKLHIGGSDDASLTAHGLMVLGDVTTTNIVMDNNEIIARDAGGISNLFLQTDGGYVGIGTANPDAPLHVSGQKNRTLRLEAYMDSAGAFDSANILIDLSHGIIAESRILAAAFDVKSDLRIKEVQGVSDGAEDLEALMGIEITDYRYKDAVAMQAKAQKKVIAQQVEKVYPLAVGTRTGVVPDIFKGARCEEGWIALDTDLKVGERVKIVTDQKHEIYEVLKVEDGRFLTQCDSNHADVFVYGREVDDFRFVDYDALAMLNISATQQVKKQMDAEVEQLQAEIEKLREQVLKQQHTMNVMQMKAEQQESRLTAIEALLERSPSSSVKTVSTVE